jgi:Type I phosphodiesterase / nucleotide pyrophosphatase
MMLRLRPSIIVTSLIVALAHGAVPAAPNNVVLFIPDGLRPAIVDPVSAPALARLRDEGVHFANSHALFPTFTTANASAMATGHLLGDTGDFSNYLYLGFPVRSAEGSVTPFLEVDPVLVEVNDHFGGNYLNEESIITAARGKGFSTALIGKVGPTAIYDVRALNGTGSVIIDDTTGRDGGVPLSQEWLDAIKQAGLTALTPARGDNGNAGDNKTPGTRTPNLVQQQYFLDMTLKVILPRFKAANRPFVLVYWARDPDATQHNQGDSLGAVVPGINGPTSSAVTLATDAALAAIAQGLDSLGLAVTTNIVVAADHGFSTISKVSKTSPAAKLAYADVNANELPVGFLAIDLAIAFQKEDRNIRLFDPDVQNAPVDWTSGQHPRRGHGLIGKDPASPQVIVAANGGSDLVYVPQNLSKRAATGVVKTIFRTLLNHDYVSGLFVDTARFGTIPGALSLNEIGLRGSAITPIPAVVVNFASFSTGCNSPTACTAAVADTTLQQGQGMHGSFSRADTWNFVAARGPDFRTRFVDPLPVSNADVGMLLARLLQLDIRPKGRLLGRVPNEALRFSSAKESISKITTHTLESTPAPNGLKTLLRIQRVGAHTYFDAAGFPGRTVGLEIDDSRRGLGTVE